MVKQGPVVNQAQLELGTCFTHNQAVGVASEATNHGINNASLDSSRHTLIMSLEDRRRKMKLMIQKLEPVSRINILLPEGTPSMDPVHTVSTTAALDPLTQDFSL